MLIELIQVVIYKVNVFHETLVVYFNYAVISKSVLESN